MFWRYLIALGIYGHVSTCLGSSDCVLPDHPAGGKWEVVKGKVGFPGDKVDSSTVLAYTCDGEIVPSYVVPCSSTVQVRCKGSVQKRGILDYFFGGDEEPTSTTASRERPSPRQKPRPPADPYGSQLEIRGGRGGDGLVLEDGDRLGARNAVGVGGRGGDVVVRGWPDYGEPVDVEVRGGDGRTGVVASGDSTWGGSIVAVGGRGGDVTIDGNRRRPTKDRTIRRGGEISDGYHWSDQGDTLVGVGGRGQDVRVRFARSTRQKRQKEIKLTQSKWTNGRSGTIKQSAYGRLDGPGTLSLRAEGHVSVGQDGVLVEGDVFGDADDDLPDWAKDLLNQNGLKQRRRRDTSKKGTSKSGGNGEGKDGENVRSNGKSVTGGDGGDGLVLKNGIEKTVEGRGGKGGDVKVYSKKNDDDDEPLTVVRGGKGGHGIIIRGDPIVGGKIRATGGRGGDATLTSSKDSKASKASKASKDSTKGHKQDSSKGHKQDSSKGRKQHDDEKKEEDAKEKSTKQTSNGQQGATRRSRRQAGYPPNQRYIKGPGKSMVLRSGDLKIITGVDGTTIYKDGFRRVVTAPDGTVLYRNRVPENFQGTHYPRDPYVNNAYPNQNGEYPIQNGGYPNQNGGYPNQNGGFSNQNGGYPIQNGGYPIQNGGYPIQNGGYPNQNGGFPNQNGGYPNQNGGFPIQSDGKPKVTRKGNTTTIKDGDQNGGFEIKHTNNGKDIFEQEVSVSSGGRGRISARIGGSLAAGRNGGGSVEEESSVRRSGGRGGHLTTQGTMAGKPRQKRQSRYAGNFRSYRNHLRRRPVISGDYEIIGSPDGGVITKSKNKKTILGGVGLGGITEVKVHRGTDDDDYDDEYEDEEDERADDRLNSAGRNNTKPNKKNQGGTRTSTNTRLGENCPVYTGDEYTRVSCYHNNRIINCEKARSRSSFNYTCSPFCEPVNRTHETGYCFDGEWTVPEPKCVPICGKKRTNAQVLVVNGKTAVLNDYPWAAAVFKVNQGEEKNVCGGTMLTRRVVLTAAHCVTDLYGKKFDNDRIKVGLGKHYNEYQDPRDLTAQYSTVDQILTHKYYRGINQHYGNDIAMLVTTKRLDLSITVQPICFKNLPSFDLVNDMRGIVTGWGYSTASGPPAGELQQLVVPYKVDDDCKLEYDSDWLDKHLTDDKFCAGFHNKSWGYTEQSGAPSVELKELFVPYKDNRACQADFSLDWLDDFLTGDKFCAGFTYKSSSVCKGDSGGGLVFPYNNRFYVQGIVSLGNNPSEGECQIQKSSLYTRVASHYDWIVEVTTQFN